MYDDARHQEAGFEDDHTQHTRMREGRGELEARVLRVTAALIRYKDVPPGKNGGDYNTRRKNNDRKYDNRKPDIYIWKKSLYYGNFERDTGFFFRRRKV